MENTKIYCLNDRSVIEVPYYYNLYDYVSYNYDAIEDNLDVGSKIEGIFMLVKKSISQFMISEEYINYYRINGYKAGIDGYKAEICVTEFKTHYGETIYTKITESPRIAPLMNCEGLSDD